MKNLKNMFFLIFLYLFSSLNSFASTSSLTAKEKAILHPKDAIAWAWYGSDSRPSSRKIITDTIKQKVLAEGSLKMVGTDFDQILGDPAVGMAKKLTIIFTDGEKKEITQQDSINLLSSDFMAHLPKRKTAIGAAWYMQKSGNDGARFEVTGLLNSNIEKNSGKLILSGYSSDTLFGDPAYNNAKILKIRFINGEEKQYAQDEAISLETDGFHQTTTDSPVVLAWFGNAGKTKQINVTRMINTVIEKGSGALSLEGAPLIYYFGDPAPGEAKNLTLWFADGHQESINESQSIDLSASQIKSHSTAINSIISAAWFGEFAKEDKRIDVSKITTALISNQNGGLNLDSYMSFFGDPSYGIKKALWLKFSNGFIVTCPESKGLNFSDQSLAAFSAATVNSFTFPSTSLGQSVVFNDSWKINDDGTGYVIFDAAGTQDIYVALSASQNILDTNAYCFIIGGWGNKHSEIWKNGIAGGDTGAILSRIPETGDSADDSVVITGGLSGTGTTTATYWIRIRQNPNGAGRELSWGKGQAVGANVKQTVVDVNPITMAKYVGFGSTVAIKYSNIAMGTNQNTPTQGSSFVTEAWYGDPTNLASKKNVSNIVATLMAQQNNGLSIGAAEYNTKFGDPAVGKAKALSLKLKNKALFSCRGGQALNLTAQTIAALSLTGLTSGFVYPSTSPDQSIIFHDSWMVNDTGTGSIIFKAAATEDINVAFSASQNILDTNSYTFVIGGSKNTSSSIWKNAITGSNNTSTILDTTTDAGALVTTGIADTYWIMIRPNPDQSSTGYELSWGKGDIVGQNVKQKVVDLIPVTEAKYVGFGGKSQINYSNIIVSSSTNITAVSTKFASAWYGDPTDTTKQKDVTVKVNSLLATNNGGLTLYGAAFDGTFGDPAIGKAKALYLKLANGMILTCGQDKNFGIAAQDIANLSDPTAILGFTYPASALGQSVIFNEQWKFSSTDGTGQLQFKASGLQDIYVAIASTTNVRDPNSYTFIIGGWGNKNSQIWKGNIVGSTNQITAASPYANTTVHPAVQDVNTTPATDDTVVTGGIPGDGTKLDDYWVRIRKIKNVDGSDGGVELSWGKGTDVGKNEKQVWIDKTPITSVKYIGLGGLSPIKYSNVRFDTGFTLPDGFVPTPNAFSYPGSSAYAIATGSYNGELDAWIINDDGKLLRYNAGSMDDDPWEDQFPQGKSYVGMPTATTVFADISSSSDGNTVVADTEGYVWFFNAAQNKWARLGSDTTAQRFDRVAIGNKTTIFAIEKTTNLLFRYINNVWTPVMDSKGMQSVVAQLSAGFDGTIAGVGTNGRVFFYSTDANGKALWTVEKIDTSKTAQPLTLTKISIGSSGDIWGVNNTAAVSEVWKKQDGTWKKLTGSGITDISINAAGTALAIDTQGNIHNLGEEGIAIDTTGAASDGGTIAVVSASYGYFDSQDLTKNKVVDVTDKIKTQLGTLNQVKVPADMASYFSKNPAPSAKKKLSLFLTYNGYPLDEIRVDDGKDFVFTLADANTKVEATTEKLKVFAATYGDATQNKTISVKDKIKAQADSTGYISVPADMTTYLCKDATGVVTDPAPETTAKTLTISLLYHGQRIDVAGTNGTVFKFTAADAKAKITATSTTDTTTAVATTAATYTYDPTLQNSKRCYFPDGRWSFASSTKAHARWIKFKAQYTSSDTVKPEINVCFTNSSHIDSTTNLIKNNDSYFVVIGGSSTNPSYICKGNTDFGIATDGKSKQLISTKHTTNLVTDLTSTTSGQDYWAKVASDGTISWGLGRSIGVNTKQSWKPLSGILADVNRVTLASSMMMNFTHIVVGISNNLTATRTQAVTSGTIKTTTNVKTPVKTTVKKTPVAKTTIKKTATAAKK